MIKLTPETLAFCYELRCEYGWPYKKIAGFVGVSENHLGVTLRAKLRGNK